MLTLFLDVLSFVWRSAPVAVSSVGNVLLCVIFGCLSSVIPVYIMYVYLYSARCVLSGVQILNYFGEVFPQEKCNNTCDNCLSRDMVTRTASLSLLCLSFNTRAHTHLLYQPLPHRLVFCLSVCVCLSLCV
jgi:hypothetical protein